MYNVFRMQSKQMKCSCLKDLVNLSAVDGVIAFLFCFTFYYVPLTKRRKREPKSHTQRFKSAANNKRKPFISDMNLTT